MKRDDVDNPLLKTEWTSRVKTELLNDPSLGSILVSAGRLNQNAVDSVLRLQKVEGLRFGEAALRLGLVKQGDVDFAMAQQFDYPCLPPGDPSTSEEIVAAFWPHRRAVEEMRVLRSQLVIRWFNGNQDSRAVAIVGVGRREGRTFIAANLAVLFAQLGARTLLIDADLRNGRLARLFALDDRYGLSGLLAGRASHERVICGVRVPNLSVLPSGAAPPNPQELLNRPSFGQLLDSVARQFDVVLVDTSAAREHADAQIVATRVGSALFVARNNRTSASDMTKLVGSLKESGAALLGSVLNDP